MRAKRGSIMFPNNQNGGGAGPGSRAAGDSLEARLRNMILTNNEIGRSYLSSPQASQMSAASTSSQGFPSPAVTGSVGTPEGMSPAGLANSDQPSASPRSSRKRLNQAQRRQMSAQLSIPIDPRPSPLHSAGSYASPPGYGNQLNQQQNRQPYQQPHHQTPYHNQHHGGLHSQGGYQHQQRPQSATVRPSHYGPSPTLQVHHGSGRGYPSQSRHQQSLSYQGPTAFNDPYNWRSQQQTSTTFDAPSPRVARPHSNSNNRLHSTRQEEIQTQAALLERFCEEILSSAEIQLSDIQDKENFRIQIEQLCQDALAKYELEVNGKNDFPGLTVRLRCFGSLSSGFATKASDMDLGLISPLSEPLPDAPNSPIPRIVEKAFLDAGLGARLLTRTRVPIIKLCEKPPEQLRHDLLEERAKWEKGLLSEHDNVDADTGHKDEHHRKASHSVEEHTPVGESGKKSSNGSRILQGRIESVVEEQEDPNGEHLQKDLTSDDGKMDGDKYIQCLASFKQPEGQSFANYCAAAKRLVRKLGGRDITHSTARDFKNEDLKILTDACHAFVAGLADTELRDRLFATRSLATSHAPSQLNYRSLYGVFMQAEGEHLAMLWTKREIREKDPHQEHDAYNKVRSWQELQNKPNFAQDLLGYNKELQLAVEGMKKVVSLQVMILEQGQFESPTQYHDRTTKIMMYCGGRDTGYEGNPILPIIIRHYINGIWNQEIREEVDSFAKSIDKPSLRAIARRHKSLQLALEFERALVKGCYAEPTAGNVKAYIDVLRLPLQICGQPGRRFDYVVPRTESTAPVVSRARQLTDPSKLTPNQPRDPYRDRLEFPKTEVGVQCDINFSAHLALQNTLLLRCYSHTDTRVRPLVLFVKHWAKIRNINTPYRGTLSSYGYVLMMLHYLVNVAQPFVCPNLQQLAPAAPNDLSTEELEETVSCRGCDIRFWRNEEEIKGLAAKGMLNQNKDSVGYLLRGFFEYYAQNNFMSTVPCRGFDWGRDVLSLRTGGGLRSKQEKGWTGARTVVLVQDQATSPSGVERQIGHTPSQSLSHPHQHSESQSQLPAKAQDSKQAGQEGVAAPEMGSPAGMTGTARPGSSDADGAAGAKNAVTHNAVETKEVKHRYLFAIEDPFELDHNVARTVTHSGIVAIRDEFRRAWRIIKNLGKFSDENLLEDVTDNESKERAEFAELLNEIHGPEIALD